MVGKESGGLYVYQVNIMTIEYVSGDFFLLIGTNSFFIIIRLLRL